MPSAEDISQLQSLLLQAVLLGTPLPGTGQPVRFPDLSFVTRQPSIVLADENLSAPISVAGAPKPVRVLSTDAIRQEAQQHGDVAYLQFAAPQIKDDQVRLTLAARIATANPAYAELGLSSIHVGFRKAGSAWLLVDDPVYSAA